MLPDDAQFVSLILQAADKESNFKLKQLVLMSYHKEFQFHEAKTQLTLTFCARLWPFDLFPLSDRYL